MTLNHVQFEGDPSTVPPEFGSQPIPEGMVRFNHYTSSDAISDIRRHGLLRSKAQESYERGGTESPQVFMTAGAPSIDLLRARPVVEGWVDPSRKAGQLDIGENWRDEDPEEFAADIERRRSTITARGDIPASQIVAIHKPWHEHYRYIMDSPDTRWSALSGEFDDLDDDYEPAVRAAKVATTAKILLGGGH